MKCNFINKIFKIILCSIVVLCSGQIMNTHGQGSITSLQAENIPQNMLINPAMSPEKSFMAFPLISGVANIGIELPINGNSLLETKDGKNYINTSNLIKQLNKKNNTGLSYNIDIANFGIRLTPVDYIGFSIRARSHVGLRLPGGAVELITDNGINSFNREFNVDFESRSMVWAELGASYSRKIGRNFEVGGRVKYLMGMASVNDGMNINITKNAADYVIKANGGININNINIKDHKFNEIASNLIRNNGFGFDLGAKFTSNDKRWKASISASDIGFINWKSTQNSKLQISNPDESFIYDGFKNLDEVMQNQGLGDALDSLKTELFNAIGVDTIYGKHNTSWLPSTFQAGVSYTIDPYYCHTVGLNFLGTMVYRGDFAYAISAGYTYRPKNNKHWQIMGNYTYKSYEPVCIGVGGVYSSRKFQIMLMTDNIIGIINPLGSRSIDIRFGMNFFFGYNRSYDSQFARR